MTRAVAAKVVIDKFSRRGAKSKPVWAHAIMAAFPAETLILAHPPHCLPLFNLLPAPRTQEVDSRAQNSCGVTKSEGTCRCLYLS
jgi:hypothetical protein